MFLKIAGFEFRYQIRGPVFWVTSIVVLLLSFSVLAAASVLQISAGSAIHKNAPVIIVTLISFFVVIYMFVTTAFVVLLPALSRAVPEMD